MSDHRPGRPQVSEVLSEAWIARLRAAATLTVLVLLVLVAVRVGVNQVSEPFPESQDAPICTTLDLAQGDDLRPADVTINVLNAGDQSGLAGRTLSDLQDSGFGIGDASDAPDDVEAVANAQIWSPDGTTAAVRLVRSYLQGKVRVVDRASAPAGLTVVVGGNFGGVKEGRAKVKVKVDQTTCVPTITESTDLPIP